MLQEDTTEIYKPLLDYEDLYQISNTGKLKSFNRWSRGKILVSRIDKGYRRVSVYKNCCQKNIAIHRAVATAFIPNPDNKIQVNHIDGNKLNNHYTNLEWCTASENNQHAVDTGLWVALKGEECTNAKLNEAKIREAKALLELGHTYTQIAIMFNMSRSAIRNAVTGKTWKHLSL